MQFGLEASCPSSPCASPTRLCLPVRSRNQRLIQRAVAPDSFWFGPSRPPELQFRLRLRRRRTETGSGSTQRSLSSPPSASSNKCFTSLEPGRLGATKFFWHFIRRQSCSRRRSLV